MKGRSVCVFEKVLLGALIGALTGLCLGVVIGSGIGIGNSIDQKYLAINSNYELICQGSKNEEHVATLMYLGNGSIRLWYLDKPLPEGKKYFKAIENSSSKIRELIPWE